MKPDLNAVTDSEYITWYWYFIVITIRYIWWYLTSETIDDDDLVDAITFIHSLPFSLISLRQWPDDWFHYHVDIWWLLPPGPLDDLYLSCYHSFDMRYSPVIHWPPIGTLPWYGDWSLSLMIRHLISVIFDIFTLAIHCIDPLFDLEYLTIHWHSDLYILPPVKTVMTDWLLCDTILTSSWNYHWQCLTHCPSHSDSPFILTSGKCSQTSGASRPRRKA